MCRAAVVFCFLFSLAAMEEFKNCFDKSTLADEHYQEIEIFSITEPTWLFNTGVQRAEYHDRQDLGVNLLAGGSLRIRQVNPDFSEYVMLLLLPFDEKDSYKGTVTIEVGRDWTEVTAVTDSVPFADTPYGDISARLLVHASCASITPLPILEQDEDETEFFANWEQHNSSFAIARNDYIQLLIPLSLRHPAQHLREFSNVFESLNDMMDFFRSFIHFLDTLLGLDGSSDVNRVPENRHFLTATNSKWYYDPFQSRYLESWLKNPTVDLLSEFSGGFYYLMHHNYSYGDENYLENYYHSGNILRTFYNILFENQYFENVQVASGTDAFSSFDYLNNTENLLYTDYLTNSEVFSTTTPYNAEVIFLLMLAHKAGTNAITAMHKDYRELVNRKVVNDVDDTILLNQYCSEYSLTDFSPYFARWGYAVISNKWSNYPAAAMLVDVVPADALSAARALLAYRTAFSSSFQLVINEDIAPLDLHGQLHLVLNIDMNIKGTQLVIKDGNRVIQQKTIQRKTISIKDVPNGIYTLEFQGILVQEYVAQPQYVYIKDIQEHVAVEFTKVNESVIMDPIIEFYGHHNKSFATLQIDFSTKPTKMTFTVAEYVANIFHIVQKSSVYASVKVIGENGSVKYNKVIKGLAMTLKESILLSEGDIVRIFHNETMRKLRSKNTVIDTSSNENSWIVTQYGLRNIKMNNDPLIAIDLWAQEIIRDPLKRSLSFYLSQEKKQLLVAIRSLHVTFREHYLGKYGSLFPQSTNTVTLIMQIDNIDILEGVTLQLENQYFVQQQRISLGEVRFQNLPQNTYIIKLPNDELRFLDIEPNVIFVNDSEFRTSLKFSKIRNLKVAGDFIRFLASTNATIENLVIAPEDTLTTISVSGLMFTDLDNVNVYSMVRDAKGFEKSSMILSSVSSNQTIPLEPGDLLEVYRSDDVDQMRQTGLWIVTDYGLQRVHQQNITGVIDETAMRIRNDIHHLSSDILALAEPDRMMYRQKYTNLVSCI